MRSHDSTTLPLLVGAYSVAGLYLGRALRGAYEPLDMTNVVLVGGTSAVAAYVAPKVSHYIVPHHSPSYPLVNAGVASLLVWGLMSAEGYDQSSSVMFLPVQIASNLLADYTISRYVSDEESGLPTGNRETKPVMEEAPAWADAISKGIN